MKLPQPERSSARPGVLVIFIVVSIVLTTLWFREGSNGPVHRLRNGVQAVAAPIETAGEFVTRPARGFFRWASDLGVSRSQFETLRTQNGELRRRVSDLEEARLENLRLRGLLNFVGSSKTRSLGARVIGRPTNSWEGVITIDRGTADGVNQGQPVVGPQGLLGQTIDVTRHSAKVRLITDPSSGVAAMVQSTRAEGVVRGSIDGGLTLEFVSRETTVRAGDVVISSGMGGVYPKGLIIGEITSVKSTPSTLYQDIVLAPAGSLSGLEEVIVLVGATPQATVGGGE